MQPSDLSGSRAGYVNKFHPADLPQQNSKTTNTVEHTQSIHTYIYGCSSEPAGDSGEVGVKLQSRRKRRR